MTCVDPVLYVLIGLSLMEAGCLSEESFRPAGAAAPGDIIIGGIFPIHEAVEKDQYFLSPQLQQCVRFDTEGLANVLALINAVETVNNSPDLRRVGVTLGYRIHNSCSDVSTALRATADLSRQTHDGGRTNTSACDRPVMAVVGASESEISIAVARQLTLKLIPQISYSSTAVVLSDKTRFPFFLRTIPNDKYQTAAIVKLLSDSGWKWVGMLTTNGDYGLSALESFVSQASEKGICVAFKKYFPGAVTSLDVQSAIREAAETIHKNPKVKVIVSFVKPAHMKYLYRELWDLVLTAGMGLESMERIWVASDSWSSSFNAIPKHMKLEDIGHVVGFTFKQGDLSSFSHYLSRLEAAGHNGRENNAFLDEFYTQLNASGDTRNRGLVSKAMERLKEVSRADTILSVEMAVSAIAQAVAFICHDRDCKRPGALQPWELLRALRMCSFKNGDRRYRFNSLGDVNLGYDVTLWRSGRDTIRVKEVVAEYHVPNNSFTYTSPIAKEQLMHLRSTVSKCANNCVPGEYKKTAEGQPTCCYRCINCTVNYYSNDTDMDLCLSCDLKTEWSPEGSSRCIGKTLQFFSWRDGFAVVLLTLVALGILLVLLLGGLFLHQRHTPIVRAAGGPLCQVILLSLVGSFISALLFVGQPSDLQCKSRQVLYGLSFTLCVSCILVKSLKILLAFQFNPAMQEFLKRLYQPYLIIGGCLAFQFLTCISWVVLKSPFYNIIMYPTTMLAECHEGSYLAFGLMLAYIAVLAFVCFICAFKGRKLPQKYNDAKFITFSMLLYLISWFMFVPVYVTTSGVYVPAVEMVVILISNYGILSCHFFPKCYIILFRKEQNTRSAFIRNVYEYSNKCTESIPVSKTSPSKQKHISQPYIIKLSAILKSPTIKFGDTEAFDFFTLSTQSLEGMPGTPEGPNGYELRYGSHIDRLLSKMPPSFWDRFIEYCLSHGILQTGSDMTYTLPDLAAQLRMKSQARRLSSQGAALYQCDVPKPVKKDQRVTHYKKKTTTILLNAREFPSIPETARSKTAFKSKLYCPFCDNKEHFLNA
ncbi:G-protein coupled receptor family C group 6 member A [Lampris incognitus]|uniref:G-protein coupled receptor family C group 6 member A n=1 Tax=Lampris incognitus TaxID=2546036 RepID=UPI0024B5A963|nr:G-protein coupled receptor family C group 6 member A [Lampris incognitus]